MKKIAIILLTILHAGVSRAQVNMIVHLTNGDSLIYNVDSIQSMKLPPVSLPRYDVIYISAEIRIPPTFPLNPGNVDSMQFGLDSLGHHILTIDYDTVPPPWGLNPTSFRLIGPQSFGPDAAIDAITFGQYEMDTNIRQFNDTLIGGDDQCAAWVGNRIYCGTHYGPSRIFDVDSNLDVLQESISNSPSFGPYCLTADSSGTYILSKSGLWGVLQEYGIQTESSEVISTIDEESNPIDNVSNAVYYRGGDDSIIFYAYGSWSDTTPNPPNAGYYLFDRKSGNSTMLLHYISDLGPNEMVNGFDVSLDGKKLLLGSTSDFRAPLVIEYDLALHMLDTIPVVFDTATLNPALWVRYSHDGTKILYSNYPFNSFSEYDETYPSEIGIIDRATGSRRALKTNPTSEGYWDCILPQWSPDDTKIVYSAAPQVIEPPGIAGYEICILKTLK